MIVDSSALLAVLFREGDAGTFSQVMKDARVLRMSVATWFEAAMAVDRRGDQVARTLFDRIVALMGIQLQPLTLEHAMDARDAWQAFGRGSQSRARLNFGDCLTYGLAKASGEPLLFKGNDFSQTDIEPALKG